MSLTSPAIYHGPRFPGDLFRRGDVRCWCAFEGIVAIALLLGGGLVALQAAALATGFPFALVRLAMCRSTWKGPRACKP